MLSVIFRPACCCLLAAFMAGSQTFTALLLAGRVVLPVDNYFLFLVNFALCVLAVAITVKLNSGKCDVRGGLNVTIERLFFFLPTSWFPAWQQTPGVNEPINLFSVLDPLLWCAG